MRLDRARATAEPAGREAGRVPALDARIARWERRLELLVLSVGVGLLALWPELTIVVRGPTLVSAGGVALLGTGLVRDLVWLALAGRPAATPLTGPPEARLCLESTLGVLALAAGLASRAWAPGAPQPVGLGVCIAGLALVAIVGQVTRHVVVAVRIDPGHRNLPFRSYAHKEERTTSERVVPAPADSPLTPEQVAALLDASGAQVVQELEALGEAEAVWHPAPGEWCVKEIVGHLIEAERRGFAGRIRTLLAEANPPFAAWDPPAVAAARRDCEQPLDRLAAEFRQLREDSLALVRALRPADLTRAGTHARVGALTVQDLLQEWVHHDRNHLKQALSNAQARVWPHMGNARGFSLPQE